MSKITNKTTYIMFGVLILTFFVIKNIHSLSHTDTEKHECILKPSDKVKIVVFVPETLAEKVLEAMGLAGAGHICNYGCCSFSTMGIARFKPMEGAHPWIGQTGTLETVQEVKIEAVVSKDKVGEIIHSIKLVHPYDEPGIDIYPMLDYKMINKNEYT